MKRIIVVLLGALLLAIPVAMPAFANIGTDDISSTWNDLTPTQQAEMSVLIAKKAAQTQAPALPDVTVEKVEPWLKLIDHLGAGLMKLAHDLGVEANQLISTPVGMMAMGLIAYHVIGDQVLEILIGLMWFTMTMPFLLLFFFKSVIPIVEYVDVKRSWFGTEYTRSKAIRRKMVFGADEDFNVDWIFVCLLILNTIITLAVIC